MDTPISRRRIGGPGLALMALMGCVLLATASSRKIELPRETGLYRPGPGVELANTHCLTCHSADYAAIQPRMPLAFWQASVKKMREKYGAEIPDAAAVSLGDYLASAYGQGPADGVSTTGVLPKSPAQESNARVSPESIDGKTLVARFGCAACHSTDRKIVGPAFSAVAGKYRNDSDASAKVLHQIQQGGGGQWGPVPMPPFPQISAGDADAIAHWILTLK